MLGPYQADAEKRIEENLSMFPRGIVQTTDLVVRRIADTQEIEVC